MTKDFVPYELAEKLKEKGFKEKCIAYYWIGINEHTPSFVVEDNMPDIGICIMDLLSEHNKEEWSPFVDAPTISQVLKWLREEKKIYVDIETCPTSETKEKVSFEPSVRYSSDGYAMCEYISPLCYFEWKDAVIAGIEYALKNLL